jgi:uncharacterized protein YegP (UPF0339 family)
MYNKHVGLITYFIKEAAMGKFVVKETDAGFHFNLLAGNGEVIGTSEVYNTRLSCENGIKSVMKNAPLAAIENQTVKDFAKTSNPKFEIVTDKGKKYRFRLTARNGQTILASQAYREEEACLKGIESVRMNSGDSKIEYEK